MNEEILRKSLSDAGIAADKIDEMVAAAKAAPPADEPKAPAENLQKALDDLAATLAKPAGGLTEEQMQEEIKKAIGTATEPFERNAKQMAAATDLLVKEAKEDSAELRKALGGMVDVVKALNGKIEALQADVAAAGAKDNATPVAEAVKKALGEMLPPRGRSVQDTDVIAHPGDAPGAITANAETVKKSLSEEDVIKAIAAHPEARTRSQAMMDLRTAGKLPNPEVVLAKYGIKKLAA